MKRWRWLLLLCGVVLLWQCLKEPNEVQKLESILEVNLPRGVMVECTDTHGGFHGDGELNAAVTFQSAEQGKNFVRQITDTWIPLPVEPKIWNPVSREWTELPEAEQGYWLFRDRYYEQYGERANYLLWNSTFALLDTDDWVLYVFKLDL